MNLQNSEKYISLETYRQSGKAVKTPVWFVIVKDDILIITREGTGKIKRLKLNSQVRIASCTMKGAITGDWISGTGKILDDINTAEIVKLRDKKYGFMARLAKMFTKGKGKMVAVLIKID